jgi:antitoxin Phd
MQSWPVPEQESTLTELLEAAEKNGPQLLTRDGVEKAVVIPIDQWKRLAPSPENCEKKPTLLEVLQSGPQFDLNITPRGSWKHRKPIEF